MKKIKALPSQVPSDLNTWIASNHFFTFMVEKKNNHFDYYMDAQEFYLNMLSKAGFQFEEVDVSKKLWIDCGGNVGVDLLNRSFYINENGMNLNHQDLIDLLKGVNKGSIKIEFKFIGRMDARLHRTLQLLNERNKLIINNTIFSMMTSQQLLEFHIYSDDANVKEAIKKKYGFIQNQAKVFNDLNHLVEPKNITFDLLPSKINVENTPNVNIHSIFEENTSNEILYLPDSIKLGVNEHGQEIGIYKKDFLLDVGVFGASGCGKGNLLMKMCTQFYDQVPMFVIAPKGEFNYLQHHYPDFKVYDPTVYWPLNVFKIPTSMRLKEYVPMLKEILKVLFDLDESYSAQAFVSQAIYKTYELYHYSLDSRWCDGQTFGLREFSTVLLNEIKQSSYANNEKGNFYQIMKNRITNCLDLSSVFDHVDSIDFHEMLNENVILDLRHTPKTMMNTVMKITMMLMIQEMKLRRTRKELLNIVMIDEAHNLFGKEDDYFDLVFADDLFELRSKGCGFIISDQRMSRLKSSVLDNLTHIINGRLISSDCKYFFESDVYDLKQAQVMKTLPVGTYSILCKGTTQKFVSTMIYPVMFTSDNIIDNYLQLDEVNVEDHCVQPFSHCRTCHQDCKNYEKMRELSKKVKLKVNWKKANLQEKIGGIVQVLGCNDKDKILCIVKLMQWEGQ